ncbi:MAG TPA: ANTAR domain-containing protein, partial [Aurantimonas sp.]|nr:ANTAR domain-containing protein [Aurantimonas sp.]
AESHLVKPVANSGIYSALLIARRGFEARQSLSDEVRGLKARVAERQTIVRAVVALGAGGAGEERAYAQLRALAMSWQTTIEDAARRVLALEEGGRDERATRL